MSCELLEEITGTSVRLNTLTRNEANDPKYELIFDGATVTTEVTRVEFIYNSRNYVIYIGCYDDLTVGDDGFVLQELPAGWNEEFLSCNQTLEVSSLEFYNCTQDPCCNGADAKVMPTITETDWDSDPELIGGE